ncbi:MAG: glycosyl hydrolase, partial [Chloroflexi bacterium]|nr:glycosyl hydrolase [Chloroflexota bacterium]
MARGVGRTSPPKEELLGGLAFRCIGPYRGGRVVAVAGDPVHRQVFYMGSTGGGVWRTIDAGLTWENVSDGFFRRASVGALAVAPSDPNVIYAGMGEACIRDNVTRGDGVYRSTDAGRTWTHRGLDDSHHIGNIRVHPAETDTVYVAALGHSHGPSRERGVYRSRDGGATWKRVLFRSVRAGAVDVSLDPNNPRVLFAATWEVLRTPWLIASVGPGGGLFRSTDGGDSWTELTSRSGLPAGPLGKIGVAVSPARSGRVYAVVEAARLDDGGIFRSDDGGDHWDRVSADRTVRERDYYYQHIYADPLDPDTVWVLSGGCFRSIDGGRTFAGVPTPHADHHDLWIDPRDPQRMIIGDDGGAQVTLNGAVTWSTVLNQPTAELYHVAVDTRTPYRVYGAQQDNSTISVPSRSRRSGITIAECYDVGGGESGHVAVRPDDPDIVFAGSYLGALTRYDHRTGQSRNIEVWPEASAWGIEGREVRYRWPWTYPIVVSPHDPGTLYVSAQHVFRSTDEGASWDRISPDLTRNDRTKMDDSVATERERYATVFALAGSPLERGLLWAGSDDGLVHVSRDGGRRWTNVTPPRLPKLAMVSIIEPSPFEPGGAYVAAHNYRLDDERPYLFRTRDHGRTWTLITRGIPRDDFTRVVRADPVRRGLLFAGTETGVYVSFDDGGSWQRAGGSLPVVPVHDLAVKDGDLVVATHGRSFWILDDITALRDTGFRAARPHLFAPRETIRYRTEGSFTQRGGKGGGAAGTSYRSAGPIQMSWRPGPDGPILLDAGMNPPDGVLVHYWLPRVAEKVVLSFRDARGTEIARFASDQPNGPPSGAGSHRFVWGTRAKGATRIGTGADPSVSGGGERALAGPLVPPGTYSVRLTVGRERSSASFRLRSDPRVAASQQDLERQHALLLEL